MRLTKDKECSYCGNTFTQSDRHQLYCSPECKKLALKIKCREWKSIRKLGPVTRICAICGKSFEARKNNQIYCSTLCNEKAGALRRKSKFEWKTDTVCKECGSTFIPKAKNQVFCSGRCKTTWGNHNKKQVHKICIGCGKEFVTPQQNQKYCSVSCSTTHSVPTVILKCADCGIEFSHKGRSRATRCPECNRAYWSEWVVQHYYKVGKNKRYYTTLFRKPTALRFLYRKICYAIWPKRCVICGEDYVGKRFQLDVHHIDCDPANDDPSNLVPLCRKCHRHIHVYSQNNDVSIVDYLFEKWPSGRQEIGAAVQRWTASHTANSVDAKPRDGHANTELSQKESVETVHGASLADEEPVQTTTSN